VLEDEQGILIQDFFLLQEQGLVKTMWKRGLDMPSDMLTKNLARPLFERHLLKYCGRDEYYSDGNNPQKDDVSRLTSKHGGVSQGAFDVT